MKKRIYGISNAEPYQIGTEIPVNGKDVKRIRLTGRATHEDWIANSPDYAELEKLSPELARFDHYYFYEVVAQ